MFIIHLSTKHYMNTNNIFKVKFVNRKPLSSVGTSID